MSRLKVPVSVKYVSNLSSEIWTSIGWNTKPASFVFVKHFGFDKKSTVGYLNTNQSFYIFMISHRNWNIFRACMMKTCSKNHKGIFLLPLTLYKAWHDTYWNLTTFGLIINRYNAGTAILSGYLGWVYDCFIIAQHLLQLEFDSRMPCQVKRKWDCLTADKEFAALIPTLF